MAFLSSLWTKAAAKCLKCNMSFLNEAALHFKIKLFKSKRGKQHSKQKHARGGKKAEAGEESGEKDGEW